jgi:hypothetical protein
MAPTSGAIKSIRKYGANELSFRHAQEFLRKPPAFLARAPKTFASSILHWTHSMNIRLTLQGCNVISSSRAVNTFHSDYKKQSLNAAQNKILYLL